MASGNDDSQVKQSRDVNTVKGISSEAASSYGSVDNPNSTPRKRLNAFAELMAHKKAKPVTATSPTAEPSTSLAKAAKAAKTLKSLDPRNGLGPYIETPEKNPEGRIVEYDDEFVVIKDKFAKASVHLLLLPRDPVYYIQHPLIALSDPAFLAVVSPRVERVRRLAANELRRRFGATSMSDAPYQSALDTLMSSGDSPANQSERLDQFLLGRDWLSEIVAGVHTHPSMNHMHIHILSRDMYSPCLKHKKHYLSFTTPFFVQVNEFPLDKNSGRFQPGDWPSWDMTCWRCGRNYKNKFKALKEHLDAEFEQWKLE